MYITEHFDIYSLCKNEIALRRGIDNRPPQFITDNLKILCENILEPVYRHFNAPLNIISGYRSADVNLAIGGDRNSDHTRGMAVDFTIPGLPNYELAVWIAENCMFTELKLECYAPGVPNSGWVHVCYNARDLSCKSYTTIRMAGKLTKEQGLRQ